MEKTTHKHSLLVSVAAFIVNKRTLLFLLYIFALVFCLFSMNWVKVENDVTTYLSEESEIRQGLEAMNANFVMPGTARVMVSNITLETAQQISTQIAGIEHVAMVGFDGTEATYKDASALFDISFSTAASVRARTSCVEREP